MISQFIGSGALWLKKGTGSGALKGCAHHDFNDFQRLDSLRCSATQSAFTGIFGLHFDFHGKADDPIGSREFAAHLAEMLERARPDYVQCDSKGNPGYSSYPTKVAYASPGIQSDFLAVWRRVTGEFSSQFNADMNFQVISP